jgi:ubiquinone/menaquinone biosynthesis C-methylase UbiE
MSSTLTAQNPAPFDSLAAQYDQLEAANPILQWMRQRVQAAALAAFPAQARLLEIGCGTGTDALFFAQRGFQIVAMDPSAEMLALAREKISQAGYERQAAFAQTGIEQMKSLIETYGRASFDAIFSNFGALNCTREVLGFAKCALQLLRPSGKLLVSVMPPLCPWEIVYYYLKMKPHEATRRWRGLTENGGVAVQVGERLVRTYYHLIASLKAIFEERFEIVEQFSLGVIAPPPYLSNHVWLFKSTRWWDEKLSGWPLLRSMGDHVVMMMKRR